MEAIGVALFILSSAGRLGETLPESQAQPRFVVVCLLDYPLLLPGNLALPVHLYNFTLRPYVVGFIAWPIVERCWQRLCGSSYLSCAPMLLPPSGASIGTQRSLNSCCSCQQPDSAASTTLNIVETTLHMSKPILTLADAHHYLRDT